MTAADRRMAPVRSSPCKLLIIVLHANREHRRDAYASTYIFVGCLGILIIIGIYKTLAAGGHPQPAAPLPAATAGKEQIAWWIFFKAFAAGCTAMTGVEAVS